MPYDPVDGRYDDRAVVRGHLSPDGDALWLRVAANDWKWQQLKTAFRKLTALPKAPRKSEPADILRLPLTWALITQLARLAELYEYQWAPDPPLNQWIYDEFTRRHAEYEPGLLKADLSGLTREPMPHQAAGAYVAAVNRRFFFADDMGVGKSGTALLALAELEARGHDPFPAFIVTPASVVDQFCDEEIPAWFPGWPVTAYRGTRRHLLSTRYKVYVMSWDVFRTDMQYPQKPVLDIDGRPLMRQRSSGKMDLNTGQVIMTGKPVTEDDPTRLPPLLDFLAPKTLILDEAHALCNTKTRQSAAAGRCARIVPNAILMSGTPITHDVRGFWRAMTVLDIRSFPDQERFTERYADTHAEDYGPRKVDGLTTANRQEFYTLVQGSMRSVRKKDVLADLPDKTYQTRVVQLPPAHRRAYEEMRDDMIAHIPDTDEPLPVMNTLAQMQRLSQLASSACDVAVEYVPDDRPDSPAFGQDVAHYTVTMREPSWKVDELMAVLAEAEGQPVVTFAPHTQLVNMAGARAEKEGYRVGYITGQVSTAQKRKTRLAFQAGEIDLLCCNTMSGGVGLNLTAAHVAVFLERPWAYWNASQAEDRVHRRGQTEQVTIIDIVAAGTIETQVRLALKAKAQSLADLIRDPRVVKELLGGLPLSV